MKGRTLAEAEAQLLAKGKKRGGGDGSRRTGLHRQPPSITLALPQARPATRSAG